MAPETKKVNFKFTPEMISRLQQAKDLTGQTLAEFTRRALDAALKKINL